LLLPVVAHQIIPLVSAITLLILGYGAWNAPYKLALIRSYD